MKKAVMSFFLTLICSSANAAMYSCEDESGSKVLRNWPCDERQPNIVIKERVLPQSRTEAWRDESPFDRCMRWKKSAWEGRKSEMAQEMLQDAPSDCYLLTLPPEERRAAEEKRQNEKLLQKLESIDRKLK